jgi:hypothetical protein
MLDRRGAVLCEPAHRPCGPLAGRARVSRDVRAPVPHKIRAPSLLRATCWSGGPDNHQVRLKPSSPHRWSRPGLADRDRGL